MFARARDESGYPRTRAEAGHAPDTPTGWLVLGRTPRPCVPTLGSTAAYSLAPTGGKAFFGHPRGLSTLSFTEMWERFSCYGMRALLVLYLTAPLTGETPGWTSTTAPRRRSTEPTWGWST